MERNIVTSFLQDMKGIYSYYQYLIQKTKRLKYVGSANEWMIDNYYLLSEMKKNIQQTFYSKANRQIKGSRKKQLYDLVFTYFANHDYHLHVDDFMQHFTYYQEENKDYFTYYELNFMKLLMQVIIVSKIHSLSKKLKRYFLDKEKVEDYFAHEKSINMSQLLSSLVKEDTVWQQAYYLEQISYQLKKRGQVVEKEISHFKNFLQSKKVTIHQLIQVSHDQITKNNLLVVHLFESLKLTIRLEMEQIYESLSFAEQTLLEEDEGIYCQMPNNNKTTYRNQLISLSTKRRIDEVSLAKELVMRANQENRHVGWLLFPPINETRRVTLYLGLLLLFTVIGSLVLQTIYQIPIFIMLFIVLLMGSFFVELFNYVLMKVVRPKTIFKIKLEKGIPEEAKTMVVIPTIIKSKDKVKEMFKQLEISYLSNQSNHLYFCLLGDASSEIKNHVYHDEEVVQEGKRQVAYLNEKYGKDLFHFVYRNRMWNEGESSYLGFERKRGALEHFNQLLLRKLTEEEKQDYFAYHTLESFSSEIRYVITLDADTKLVLGSASLLVGAMLHPMNKPVLSKEKDRVVSGYGIMQPRVGIDVEVTDKSLYAQLFAGLGGLDAYIRESSHVYQDVFLEGSFVGKGIYDLAVFDQVLTKRFPRNLILSHDLLEGSYLRCGFINDVQLFDDFPSSYLNDSLRHHRWNRGDYQISGWLFLRVKNEDGKRVSNPLTLLSKWKILDNLRRSFVPISLFILLLYGVLTNGTHTSFYVTFVLSYFCMPIVFYLLTYFGHRSRYDIRLRYYLRLLHGFFVEIHKVFVRIIALPYETYLYLDSTIKALYRKHISKKHLLSWVTAEEVEKTAKNTPFSFQKRMWINTLCALVLPIITYFLSGNLVLSMVFSVFFVIGPIFLYVLSKKIPSFKHRLNQSQILDLTKIAHRTWLYFEHLLTKENHYLIPDNYQLGREVEADYKTSPTNIGFSLLSVISAYEMGFISREKTNFYLFQIMTTIEELPKWKGHLFNWYHIQSKKQIVPYLISSVDSGNFIASLYVLLGFFEKINDFTLQERVQRLIDQTDFLALYNKELDVFSIGYDLSNEILLPYHYNHFSSEARLTSFVAIAKGDVPSKHWFCLDKSLTKYKHYKGVASFSGSAFEYFMPLIFMRTYPHTLLDETYHLATFAHKDFMEGIDEKLPWGISESASSSRDDAGNYKYQSFGIPYLKMQEIKKVPLVISPYSSIMAITVAPFSVYENIKKLKKVGLLGTYGFYESYDHDGRVVVKSYFAHHQGMILTSLVNYLKEGSIQNLFHQNKNMEAYEILLKEKVQLRSYIDLKISKYKGYEYPREAISDSVREYSGIPTTSEYGILSNGYYTSVLNSTGASFSKYQEVYLNRYRNVSLESYGIFFYLRNQTTGTSWSSTYEPLPKIPEKYSVVFSSDRVKYLREDEGISTITEVTVVKDHNAELRKLTIKNHNPYDVSLNVTAYSEMAISLFDADVSHRTFGSLMIDTSYEESTKVLLFRKKKRGGESDYVGAHMFTSTGQSIHYDTARSSVLGRNKMSQNPTFLENPSVISNKVGSVIDPVLAFATQIDIPKEEEVTVYLIVGIGKTKAQVMEMIQSYDTKEKVTNGFELSSLFTQMRTIYENYTLHQLSLFGQIVKRIYGKGGITQKRKQALTFNQMFQKNLWRFGISGDIPLIVIELSALYQIASLKEVLEVYEYFKNRGLSLDVVVLNHEQSDEMSSKEHIQNLFYRMNSYYQASHARGSLYQIKRSDMTEEEYVLFQTVSVITFDLSLDQSFMEQLQQIEETKMPLPNYPDFAHIPLSFPRGLEFYNGYGGFFYYGREYVITNPKTPMPWINVLANPQFGSVISSTMGGFTYTENSREFKLTAFSNDPITDPASEFFVINNQKLIPNMARHGFGYSTFSVSNSEYDVLIKVFVHREEKTKFYDFKIDSKSNYNKNLEISFFIKTVLGNFEEYTHNFIQAEFDRDYNLLRIQNRYHEFFEEKEMFVGSTMPLTDYEEYENGYHKVAVMIALEAMTTQHFSFFLGENKQGMPKKYDNSSVEESYREVTSYWKDTLQVIQVDVPDRSFGYLLNGWLLYQTLSARLYARTGFYQVGGAYGYRDQLQDCLAVVYADPDLVKRQILKHASHQFKEGDVLHWWHEELKFGSKTKFSDDYLWLVYVTFEYMKITGDYDILEEEACFVTSEPLKEQEHEKGVRFEYLEEKQTLYEHLKLCMTRALQLFGEHNLPLMGSGDWNDGMSMIGIHGKGESVFVGFFLYDLLGKMMEVVKRYNENDLADVYEERMHALKQALHKHAWDGKWYLRAYFDDGNPLGSHKNIEGKIDLLSQSWSIISAVATEIQKETLLSAVEEKLVDYEHGLVKLLTPGFQNMKPNPGYIMDYTIGVRENGAQYTHAVYWYVLALLKAGKTQQAYQIYQLINPIAKTQNEGAVERYQVEPYVIPADVYSNPENLGRGGWTFYTGSSAWAYKVALEEILGFQKRGDLLKIIPKVPHTWSSYKITYQYGSSTYIIQINNPKNLKRYTLLVSVDGKKAKDQIIRLKNDKKEHIVVVTMVEEVL